MKNALLLTLFIIYSLQSYSQVRIYCETGDVSGSSYTETVYQNTYVYQTFTPCETGILSSVKIGISQPPSSMSFAILDADNNAAVLYSETYTNAFTGDNTFDLSAENIQVTAGNTYTIRLGDGSSFFRVTRFDSDVYAGGSMFVGTTLQSYDMRFLATIATDISPDTNDQYAEYTFTAGSLEDGIEVFPSDVSDIVNEGSSTAEDRFGTTDNARSFSYGNTAYIPHYLMDITSDFTINAWFKLVNLDNANPKYILDSRHGLNGTETGGLSILLSETKELKVQTFKTAGGFANTMDLNTEFPVDDDWYMVSVVNSGGTLTVYLDGISVGTDTPTGLDNGERWNLGYIAQASNNTGLRREFPGSIDDIKFIQRALTSTEINTLFSEGSFSKSWGPTSVSLSNAVIEENVAIGTVVGTLGSTSLETGETYTFSVGGTDAAAFTVANGNELQLAATPDFETQPSYEIEITASDASNNTFTETYTITITDEIELGPNDEYAKYSFINGSFADEINAFDRSLDATGNATADTDRFGFTNYALQIATGQVASVADTIINIEKDFSINLWINLEDASSANPKYILDSRHDLSGTESGGMSILLNASNELRVHTFKTTGGFSNTLDYSTGSTIAVDGWHMVTVTGSGGSITVYLDGTSLGSGTPSSIQNGVSWAIGYIPQSSGSGLKEFPGDLDDISFFQKVLTQAEITAFFSETAANIAPSDIDLSGTSVEENVAVGSSIGTLSTTDVNVDDTHTYTVSGIDAAFFDVSGSDFITADEIDFETQNSFEITITTTDSEGASYAEAFTITVNNVNEAPTAIAIDYDQVNENMAAGTYVGDLSATDEDADETFTFSTTSTDFTIDGVELKTAVAFDYETASTADVEITVTDSEGATYTETLTINILDVDYPQVIKQLSDVVVAPGFGTYTIDLTQYFYHDSGLAMTYQVSSYDSIATVTVTGTELVITEVAEGSTPITIVATDPNEESTSEKDGSFTFSIADVSSNLIAYYPSPDGVDASGSDNNATPDNITSVEDRFGNAAEAYDFNGSSSYMDLPSSILVKDQISISLWFKTSDFGAILGYQNTSVNSVPSSYVPVITIDDADQELYGAFWQSTTSAMAAGNESDNEWHHLVLTGTSGAQTLYVDNELVNSSTAYTKISLAISQLGAAYTGGNWDIGNGGWFYYDGVLDDVRIYESVLSAAQVAALYNLPEPGTPELVSPIADIELDEDAQPQTLVASLSSVFSNPNASSVSYEVSHNLGSDVELSLSNANAILLDSLVANFNGSGTITLTASIGDTTLTDEFTLTINTVNDAPTFTISNDVVNAPINFASSMTVEITADAVPSDETNQTVTYSISPGSVSFANVSIDSSTGEVTFTSITDQIGTETFTISANDGQAENNTASATFTFSVLNNQAPTVVSSISDLSINEDSTGVITSSISSVFSDADGDELTYSVAADTSAVIPSIDGDTISLTLAANYNGISVITVTASDGTLQVSDVITLTVNAVNDAPIVVSQISDQAGTEDIAFSYQISLDNYTDVEGDVLSIESVTFVGQNETDGSWLSINDAGLISGTPDQANVGTTLVTVTITDNALSVSNQFQVIIQNVNNAPVLANALSLNLQEDAEAIILDLDTIFTDEDNDDLTYTIASSESESDAASIFTTSLSGGTLTIQPNANSYGSAGVLVTASDSSTSVSYTIPVTITSVNDSPEVVNNPTVELLENGEGTQVDVTELFSDVDGDDLSYALQDFSSEVIIASLSEGVLTITPNSDVSGSAVLVITASDGQASANAEITVVVGSLNELPELISSPTVTLDEDAEAQTLDLTTVFTDPDGDDVSYSINVNETSSVIFTISLDGDVLTITPNADAFGNGVIQLTAYDQIGGEAGASYDLPVTVASVNDAPVFTLSTSEIQLTHDFVDPVTVDIALEVPANESDETITFSASESDQSLVSLEFKENQLIISSVSGASGTEVFTITASDGNETNGTYSQTITITVESGVILATEFHEVQVYPNPASSQIEITGPEASYSILNMKGQRVMTGITNTKVGVTDLAEGIYLLQIESTAGTTTKKLIIKH